MHFESRLRLCKCRLLSNCTVVLKKRETGVFAPIKFRRGDNIFFPKNTSHEGKLSLQYVTLCISALILLTVIAQNMINNIQKISCSIVLA